MQIRPLATRAPTRCPPPKMYASQAAWRVLSAILLRLPTTRRPTTPPAIKPPRAMAAKNTTHRRGVTRCQETACGPKNVRPCAPPSSHVATARLRATPWVGHALPTDRPICSTMLHRTATQVLPTRIRSTMRPPATARAGTIRPTLPSAALSSISEAHLSP